MLDKIALGGAGPNQKSKVFQTFVEHDQNPELIRTNGEGGGKHSWEDAREFVLINMVEEKRAGSICRGTMVEPLLPYFMRGLVSAGVGRPSETTGLQCADLHISSTLLA